MSNKILVTDSLFIFDEHVKKLKAAGYEVERIDKPNPSIDELTKAIKDKVAYILGGVERVNDDIIDAADQLKIIALTGIDYKSFIPAWQHATEKGIAIVNTPDTPTQAVAEWAITAALMMARGFLELGRTGDKSFMTTSGLEDQKIGIIGLGRVGKRIAGMLKPFKPASISYFSTQKHDDSGLEYIELDQLLAKSDVIFLCVPRNAGDNFINKSHLEKTKQGALLVNIGHPGLIEKHALLDRLKSGKLRAISDHSISEDLKKDIGFDDLPLGSWFCFNGPNGFNTVSETKLTSDEAVNSVLNVLKTGEDKNLVNPEYKKAL